MSECVERVEHGEQLALREGAVPRLADIADRTTMHPLRALRLWHWRHALQASAKERDGRASATTLTLARQSWNFHMGMVQALNDLFPIGDYAEQDDREENLGEVVMAFKVPG